ncbi:MAG: VanZ family protein [Parvibaculum sp.]|jgi:VanZ family protein
MPRQSRRLTLLLRVLWFFLFGVTLFGSLSMSVGPPALFSHADKVFHFGAWGALSGLAFLAFAGRYNRLAIPSALLVISAAIEVLQTFIPGRSGSHEDLAANAAGIALGSLVGLVLRRPLLAWLDRDQA